MLYNAKEGKLELSGSGIDYIRFGRGANPLIMIQGLNTRGIKGSALPLAYMYRCFAKDYTVYLFERRPDISAETSVRDMAEDIALAMEALNIQKSDVFGVSQGGMIAQYLAIDRPELVGKLVLAVTLSRNNDTVKAVIGNWVKLTEEGRIKQLVEDMALKMYSDAYLKMYRPLLPLLTVFQKPKDPERFIALAKSCLSCEAYDELDKISCPVFVIGAEQDRIVTGEASKEIAEKLGCKLYMYNQLGHAAYEEAKDFNKKVLDFLKE